jgi:hypothetical protein
MCTDSAIAPKVSPSNALKSIQASTNQLLMKTSLLNRSVQPSTHSSPAVPDQHMSKNSTRRSSNTSCYFRKAEFTSFTASSSVMSYSFVWVSICVVYMSRCFFCHIILCTCHAVFCGCHDVLGRCHPVLCGCHPVLCVFTKTSPCFVWCCMNVTEISPCIVWYCINITEM